ncbi:MAG TPA: chalcone isomerase family protein [Aromatoleum sp.]|uniref:chalcone isomerase family protein n=1 Tax=Aromatoleum sp. TaxID=2307007 RepID=UPI002B46851A|nr:chalcone isomerase family protein [Aromatoleum sp.]HJV25146.1 chalcone isomerase family protein [Aromatoleum sp.]
MSCSSNSRMHERRRVLLALLAMPLAALASPEPMPGLRRWGSGTFRRLGLLIYEATLWAGDDPLQPPLALRLDYHRSIRGAVIVEASVKEMKKLGSDEAELGRWAAQMRALFPDVVAGDSITGLYHPDGAVFLHNGRGIGEIADTAFARRFFGIWLDAGTSAPELRAALLGRSGDGR